METTQQLILDRFKKVVNAVYLEKHPMVSIVCFSTLISKITKKRAWMQCYLNDKILFFYTESENKTRKVITVNLKA
mgnify:CR=1 FL=1